MAVFSALAALGTAAGLTGATAGATAGAAGATTSLAGTLGAIGTGVGLAGTGLQVAGAIQANSEAKKQAELQKTQMNFEANRQKRQIIRQAVAARSLALTNASAQGAQDSSGLAGGLAQIGGDQGSNVLATQTGQDIGNRMFASQGRLASAQTMSSVGSGVSSLGGALVKNQEELARLGIYYTS